MVSKNLHVSTHIEIPIKCWYFVGMSRSENLCMLEILFLLVLFQAILMLWWIYLATKILKWYIYQNGVKNINIPSIFIPHWHQILWNRHYRYPNGIKIGRQYLSTFTRWWFAKHVINEWLSNGAYGQCQYGWEKLDVKWSVPQVGWPSSLPSPCVLWQGEVGTRKP